MFLKSYKKNKNNLRWKNVVKPISFCFKYFKLKLITTNNFKSKGCPKLLRTRFNIKTTYYNINNYKFKNEVLLLCNISYNNFYKKYYFLIKNAYNYYYYVPSIYGLFVGDYIINTPLNYYLSLKNKIGVILPLKYINITTIISNIKLKKTPIYIKSSGCFGLLLNKINHSNKVSVILPSSKILYFTNTIMATIGRNFNINKTKEYLGGFSESYRLGHRPIVRGVAKNPVDHPNGGRTKAKSPELSLWGWVAKKNR